MYRLLFTKQAQRFLLKLPKDKSAAIVKRLEQIAKDPYAHHNNVTKLQNRPGYRLRVGDGRVIYDIRNEELVILVLKIAPRGEVYR
jgi:mRNA interferase RelE/StbE